MNGGGKNAGHPEIWAVLTIITFPIVLIASGVLGVGQWWSIIFAILATFSVLVLETIVRGRLWPFEKGFVDSIGHPETPFRIMVFLGATLLVLETVAILGAVTDPRFDEGLLSLVIRKECGIRHFSRSSDLMCRFLTQPQRVQTQRLTTADVADHAITTHAAALWVKPGGTTTCALRSLERHIDTSAKNVQEAAIVQCTQWVVSENGELIAKSTQRKFVGALLEKKSDGLYEITRWSDDPTNPTWDAALGDMAESCRGRTEALSILPEFISSLQDESKQKAADLLKM
ncbi:MAG: hypothetical protein ABIO72_01370 [Patescibacteria group bacterium]